MANQAMNVVQSSTLPPAQPAYVLRGHTAQIHAVHFLRHNLKLLSGDAEGWVVLWSVPSKRAVAVWQAHTNAILGLGSWGVDRIITHGRDNKLQVWQLREQDEETLSTVLPIDDDTMERKTPKLLHSLPVNALNFCSFSMCPYATQAHSGISEELSPTPDRVMVATPGLKDGHVNLTALPGEERVATIANPPSITTGMVMAIGLYPRDEHNVIVAVGYESGYTCVFQPHSPSNQWQMIYSSKIHSQPILSLDLAPGKSSFYTSSADAVIAQHPLSGVGESKVVQTKHAGQQSLVVRSDERIFATAGWDSRVRVYSIKTMKELAVLKWHKEGVYALAFADVDGNDTGGGDHANNKVEGTVAARGLTVSELRTEKARITHWLAAGSKDGKISLWDVY